MQAHMNMSNFELAIDDYTALLVIKPNNSVVQQKINTARLGLVEMTRREKSMYSNIFNKVGCIHLFVSF